MNPTISIVNKSELEEGRLDAEFYQPAFLKNKQSVTSIDSDSLGNLTTKIVVGYVSSMVSQYTDDGVDLLQTRNVAEFFVKTDEVVKINPDFHQKLKKSQVKKGDILVARSGSFGNASLYLDDRTVNSADIIIVEADKSKINPFYLTAFLNSQKGKLQLYRFASGGLQGHVNTTILHNLKISKATDKIEAAIQELITKSYNAKISSEKTLKDTYQLLLNNLGFENRISNYANFTARSYKDYLSHNRLDAEFWLPKYDEILSVLASYSNGCTTIGKSFKQIKPNFKSEKDKTYNYVEIGDININKPDYEFNELFSEELPANAKIIIDDKTLVTSKVRPNRGATAILNGQEYVLSGAFVAFQEKDMNLETLYTFLKLDPIKDLLLRYNTGTSYPTITDTDVLNLPIPNFTKDIQDEVKTNIALSSDLLRKSKTLLDIAKKSIEIFVEQNEADALSFIREKSV